MQKCDTVQNKECVGVDWKEIPPSEADGWKAEMSYCTKEES